MEESFRDYCAGVQKELEQPLRLKCDPPRTPNVARTVPNTTKLTPGQLQYLDDNAPEPIVDHPSKSSTLSAICNEVTELLSVANPFPNQLTEEHYMDRVHQDLEKYKQDYASVVGLQIQDPPQAARADELLKSLYEMVDASSPSEADITYSRRQAELNSLILTSATDFQARDGDDNVNECCNSVGYLPQF